jgi:hypothetical protein
MLSLNFQQLAVPVAQAAAAPSLIGAVVASSEDQIATLFETGASTSPMARERLQADSRPVLFLVHGIAGENDRTFHWGTFLQWAARHSSLTRHYRILLLRYDSNQSVAAITQSVHQLLLAWAHRNPAPELRFIGYSEGGIICRNVLRDPVLLARTARLITIASPFHGTPLATPAWMRAQFQADSMLNPVRLTAGISYRVARQRYPSFQQDFRWDNFDNAMPETVRGVELPLPELRQPNAMDELLARKLVTYGGFFGADRIEEAALLSSLSVEARLPQEGRRADTLFSKHFLFSLVRRNIARVPLQTRFSVQDSLASGPHTPSVASQPSPFRVKPLMMMAQAAQPPSTPLSVFNDGMCPVSSSLWLGRMLPKLAQKLTSPLTLSWHALSSLRGQRTARLFAGMDHRDWMDGSTRSGQRHLQDLLNPDQPQRSVFEWLAADLSTG